MARIHSEIPVVTLGRCFRNFFLARLCKFGPMTIAVLSSYQAIGVAACGFIAFGLVAAVSGIGKESSHNVMDA
tara:strand:- start:983 stop:1201 length:219 start_codon:yes stop_codon:yes gene_type:complete